MKTVLPNLFHLMEFWFSDAIAAGIKELIEHKHLYQSIIVTFPPFDVVYQNVALIPFLTGINKHTLKECQLIYDSANEFQWHVESPVESRRAEYHTDNVPKRTIAIIDFIPPTIKTLCSICESIQPYNFTHGIDFSKDFREINNHENPIDVQIFMLAYQCQACKSLPEVFMIRREKMKLIQSGRTPMEQVEIPKFIPKAQRKYFSDAIFAFNSGQTLAGKFLF